MFLFATVGPLRRKCWAVSEVFRFCCQMERVVDSTSGVPVILMVDGVRHIVSWHGEG